MTERNHHFRYYSLAGLTYLEVLAGIAIISFILVGMNGIFGVGIKNNKKAEDLNIAIGLAQELMEQIRGEDFIDIANVEGASINGFNRKAEVIPNYEENEDRKLVAVTVSGTNITDVELRCIIVDPSL